ncbi:tripartite tricarboxylate transporter substrate binding protein [Succinivibrio dextrinosolvens]|uniref:Tripartite-type tricarboxylate transporter, receptor component TctC n=1 Tax=Succinivibrio dextrinosolvens TaxID=83771 RepID=A0A662Z6T4_9GAMM|nr:tripartite tricarboxylate transporter substrate binding protein [Succinivibrio dextrinosolvens]SFJ84283.1 Tripartite-type tricarboxylate transporter, receptor component TctC [Succinivibrio dextrinosolvens]
MKILITLIFGVLSALISFSSVAAEWKPTKEITIIVPYKAGGGTDMSAQAIKSVAEKYIKQKITIKNITGEDGIAGVKEIVKANPDGQTIGYVNLPTFAAMSYLPGAFFKVSDVVPICGQNTETAIIVVNADSKYMMIEDLVEDAKKHPGKIKAATNGYKASYHTGAQLFAHSAGFKYTAVHCDGTVNQLAKLLTKEVDFICVTFAEIADLVLSSSPKLRVVGVFGNNRISALPDVPTLEEAGYYNKWYGTIRGIVAPHGVSNEVIKYYTEIFKKIMSDPAVVREHFKKHMTLDYQDNLNFEAAITQLDYFCRSVEDSIYKDEPKQN